MPKPLDIRALTPAATVRLVNSTPLGAVLSAARLRAHRDAAGLRIAAAGADGPDGRRVDFPRYVAWLAMELQQREAAAEPEARAAAEQAAADRYVEARRRQAERNRAATKAAQDIWPIPDVADPARRRATTKSLRKFAEEYFAATFWRPWSPDHLRVIRKIERAVDEGGLFALAMPRGSGKSSLAWCAALWAILTGRRPYVCLIGGAEKAGRDLLRGVRMALLENPLLAADWPEACHPLRALDNSSKRQLQQHVRGRLTHVHWGRDRVVFATLGAEDLPETLRKQGLAESPCSGAIITATSLDANLRGQQHARADGAILRPSLVLLDDPQTRDSARSADQTAKRMELLHGDVLGMAGPGEHLSALMTCTVMYEDDLADRILDPKKSPEWDSERTRLLDRLPTNEELWDRYGEVRRTKGRAAATKFYRSHRKAMDRGAKASWPARFDERGGEISAIQHAMNLRLKLGPAAFDAEYQNAPTLPQASEQVLKVEDVLKKTNGHRRSHLPPATTTLTMFVDLHDRLLYYAVCAWQQDFTGYLVEYGTSPAQTRRLFTLADAPRTLGRAFPGAGADGAIHAGLERLVAESLGREWKRGGGLARIDRLLVDSGYKPGIVEAVQRKVASSTMMASKGMGIRASRKPMAAYARRPGETLGYHWYIPNVSRTAQFRHILIDTNYWKSFVHDGLAAAASDRGCISLYGTAKTDHSLFAEQVARSERWVEVTGPFGTVREWSVLPTKPDNHWLDCLVGCAAAASLCGVQAPGQLAPARRRKRYTQADLTRKRA